MAGDQPPRTPLNKGRRFSRSATFIAAAAPGGQHAVPRVWVTCARGLSRWPCAVMLVSMGSALVGTVAAMPLSMAMHGGGRSAYSVEHDSRTQRLDAWIFARGEDVSGARQPRQTERAKEALSMIYEEAGGGNLLTEANVRGICDLERRIAAHPEYPDFCLRCAQESGGEGTGGGRRDCGSNGCVAVQSICKYVFPDASSLAEGSMRPVEDVVAELAAPPPADNASAGNGTSGAGQAARFLLDNEFSASNPRTVFMRSSVSFGFPLAGYADDLDDIMAQKTKMREFFSRLRDDILGSVEQEQLPGTTVVVRYSGGGFMKIFFAAIMAHDFMLVGMAFLFVWVFLTFYLRSPFLSTCGVLHIFISFPFAVFWVKVVGPIRYFDMMNIFLLFIIAGIGADDVIIITDSWRQAAVVLRIRGDDPDADVAGRMALTLWHSVKAMFVTSFTTACAFGATATSPLMPSRAFGILAGVMIVVNYLLVCTWYPAVLVVHHRTVAPCWARCRAACRGAGSARPPAADAPPAARPLEVLPAPTQPIAATDKEEKAAVPQKAAGTEGEGAGAYAAYAAYAAADRFFYGTYAPLLHRFRFPIIAVFAGVLGIMVSFAVKVEGATSAPDFLPDDHMITQASRILSDRFRPADMNTLVRLFLVWGIQGSVDRQGHSIFDFGSAACNEGPCGVHLPDPHFSFDPPAAQAWVLETCAAVRRVRWAAPNQQPRCFAEAFADWRAERNLSFPVADPVELRRDMTEFLAEPAMHSEFVRNKAVKLGEAGQPLFQYISTELYLEIDSHKFYPHAFIAPMYEGIQAFERERNAKAPQGVERMFFTTHPMHGLFVKAHTSKVFTESAFSGFYISFLVATAVMFASTVNIIATVFAMGTIGCIIATVFGTFGMRGVDIGVIEAMCTSLIVGFSVDAAVHLSNAYMEAGAMGHERRFARLRHAMLTMGSPILSGALTTLGASLFLFPTHMQMFAMFGSFVCTTIVSSAIYSLALLAAVLAAFGPEGTQGDLRALCRYACGGGQTTATAVECANGAKEEVPAGKGQPDWKNDINGVDTRES